MAEIDTCRNALLVLFFSHHKIMSPLAGLSPTRPGISLSSLKSYSKADRSREGLVRGKLRHKIGYFARVMVED